MVGDPPRPEPQAGDVCVPVLPRAVAVDDRAHAADPGRGYAPTPPRTHGVRDGREAGGPAAVARAVARDAAAARRPAQPAAASHPNPLIRLLGERRSRRKGGGYTVRRTAPWRSPATRRPRAPPSARGTSPAPPRARGRSRSRP